jgi:hypothetical protein
MKAEQRKELETNTLADKMGQVVQKVKAGTRKTVLIYAAIAAAVLVGGWAGYKWHTNERLAESEKWVIFHDGARGYIDGLRRTEGEAGKAARFQAAWFAYWETGVKLLGSEPRGALQSLKEADKMYTELAEQCKDDPIFEPQALLGHAVVTETLAVQDRANLEKAGKLYDALITTKDGKYKDSAEGKFAQERLKLIKDGKDGGALAVRYQELESLLNIAHLRQLPQGFPGNPHLFDKKPPEK